MKTAVLGLLMMVAAGCQGRRSVGGACDTTAVYSDTPSSVMELVDNPRHGERAFAAFDRCINVNGLSVYGEPEVSDEKLRYVASILMELLDNDEDGRWDDPAVVSQLVAAEAVMPVFTEEGSGGERAFFRNYDGRGVGAVLYDDEVDPSRPGRWGTDATIEECMHTVNAVGHVEVYPDVFGLEPDSSVLSAAMDVARGGQFRSVPRRYPDDAWYHYDDRTCDYGCMAIEYLYWAQVTYLGVLNDRATCAGIADEWELCSPASLAQMDTAIHAVMVDPAHPLPQLAPDGGYAPTAD